MYEETCPNCCATCAPCIKLTIDGDTPFAGDWIIPFTTAIGIGCAYDRGCTTSITIGGNVYGAIVIDAFISPTSVSFNAQLYPECGSVGDYLNLAASATITDATFPIEFTDDDGINYTIVAIDDCVDPKCGECLPCCDELLCLETVWKFPDVVHGGFTTYRVNLRRSDPSSCLFGAQCIEIIDGVYQGTYYFGLHVMCVDGVPTVCRGSLSFYFAFDDTTFLLARVAANQPISCSDDTTVNTTYPTSDDVSGSLTISPSTSCDDDGCSVEGCDAIYRHVYTCTGTPLNIVMLSTDAASIGAFKYGDSDCLTFGSVDVCLPPGATIITPGDITAYDSCEACNAACDADCITCTGCPDWCPDDGKTFLTIAYRIEATECSKCDGTGCGRCCNCGAGCAGCGYIPSGPHTNCPCFLITTAEACHAAGKDWYCDPDCDDAEYSLCSHIGSSGTVDLPVTSHTSTSITFSDTISFSGNTLVMTVVFHCDTQTFDVSFIVNTKCTMIATGIAADCNSNTDKIVIPMHDALLESECVASGESGHDGGLVIDAGGMVITRSGCA